jgi:hypothetical protein
VNIMKKLLAIPAYLWAVVCLLIIPVTFIRNDTFAEQLATLSFMKVHPVYSGGELNRKYQQDSLTISVNKPVSATLLGSRKQQLQVTFSQKGHLPGIIDQTIDYDFDANPDFKVTINTASGETQLTPLVSDVRSCLASSKVKEDWVIRVNLDKK